ncbi:hypothetical protein QTL91_24530, partial [Salmonella enterica subsp. enterica serovar Typhimurium]|nr:hypothetical protein [Salmonella enterica subsp. enterica serovar Typhimurium]
LEILGPSLTQGENLLSEFEIHAVIRDARNVPEYYQGLSIEGLAKLVLEILGPSLTQGENLLSEFEIHAVIRDARNVPE